MAASEDSVKEKLTDSLSQQLSEYELLKSMYPNSEDIILTDTNILVDIANFVENESGTEYTPGHLDFTLNLNVDGLKLEVSVNLPTFYPSEEADLYVRCNQLNRYQETSLNSELSNFLKENFVGEVCIYSAVSWLQDNITKFTEQLTNKTSADIISEPKSKNNDKFVRLWIYSHHIYNKRKRDEIQSKANDLNLTGFCLPGKPGIICVEGADSDCKEWWSIIKSMSWKKIVVKNTETFEISEKEKEQRFHKFQELHFPHASVRSKHADMSGLSKYMDERGLTDIFKNMFGISEI
ncbi:RWD domain-containing protein 2B [Leguminivora glycinivorella]|uniref:RWD domain-containing protein 2B n=1 Tax=Leguminivora glycinivorella TaxID=1035111 RepID=UPI00201043CC|nr:RWD domain-containing protein 2B [Leguminivora glycinivorella]